MAVVQGGAGAGFRVDVRGEWTRRASRQPLVVCEEVMSDVVD